MESDTTSDLDALEGMMFVASDGADIVLASHHDGGQLANVSRHRRFLSKAASSAIPLRSRPMPVISTSTLSPGLSQRGGCRFAPTPPGVPVAITSPGTSGVKSEQKAMICGTE